MSCGSKKSHGQTILVPKYKRTDKGKREERMASLDKANGIGALLNGNLRELIGEAQHAQAITHLFEVNWHGRFYEAKAIVDASEDPATDKKCWAKLGYMLDAKQRAKITSQENIAQYEKDSYCTTEYLQMCGYLPNEMSLNELCIHALAALCMPPKSQRTAQILWLKMLELFKAMDIHLEVENVAHLLKEQTAAECNIELEEVDAVTLSKRMERTQR